MWQLAIAKRKSTRVFELAPFWVLSGLIAATWIGAPKAEAADPPEFTPAELEAAAQRALSAIISLQDPSTGLIDSYNADAEENPAHEGHEAFVFDQAVSLIALAHAGQSDGAAATAAQALAQRLIDFQEPAGYWAWAYRSDSPSKWITNGTIATGPNAWVAYALLYYASTLNRPNAPAARGRAAAFAHYAIDSLRDPNSYDYKWGTASSAYSTEVNSDMWWLLSSLGRGFLHAEGGSPRSGTWWADRLYGVLTTQYWNESQERWNRGRSDDTWVSEDAQSWGSIASFFSGDLERQDSPLTFALGNLLQEDLDRETCFFGDLALDGMEDNVDPANPTPCFQTIWNEGSGHIVCALHYAGRGSEAIEILNSLVASETQVTAESEVCSGSGLRGWSHSLESVSGSCQGSHYGPEYGIHAGASAWVYFAIRSRLGDLLPYRDVSPVPVPSISSWWFALPSLLALIGLWSLWGLRR